MSDSAAIGELREELNAISKDVVAIKNVAELNFRSWFSREQAAQYLGISTQTIDRKRRAGDLREYLLKGTTTIRFKREDLDQLMT